MAFPTVGATATTTAPSETASPASINLPASISSGDLLIVYFAASKGSGPPTFTTPTNWTALSTALQGDSVTRVAVYYKVADGSEGATLSITCSGSAFFDGIAYRISTGSYSSVPQDAIATGNDANPDPPNLAPGWGALDILWIATATSGNSITADPANYGNLLSVDSGVARHHSVRRNLNASSEDPGTFSITSYFWVASTIAVKPVVAAATSSNFLLMGVGV